MALFSRGEREKPKETPVSQVRPVVSRQAHCRICGEYRPFTKCWMRVDMVNQCPCCGLQFEDVQALYRKFQPACPKCGEFLEQPGFEYGLCDACGSKFEVMPGSRPGLLPNKAQRTEMEKHGRVWRIE